VLISIATALVGTLVPLQFTLEIHGFTIWNFGAILSPLLWAISLVTIVFYSAFAKNTTPIPKMPLALQLHTQVSTENL
jgi:4-hydroxybenzoate polyprenyltransferase